MIDTSSLFLHVLAAIGIVGGGAAQALAGNRLRLARTGRDIAVWARFIRSAGSLIASSAVVSFLTGGHLAGAVWTTDARSGFSFPFITLGAIALVTLVPIGPMVGGARLRRLTRDAETIGEGPAPRAMLVDARAPELWGPINSLVGVGVGLVALMIYKPNWGIGAVMLLVTFAAGWMAGNILASRANAAMDDVSKADP